MNTDIRSTWKSHSFRAMGSQFTLWLDTDETLADLLFSRAEEQVHHAESLLSRFNPHSELSQINRSSGERISVSPLTWDVTEAALRLAEETEGLFDPTLLGALEQAGYRQSLDQLGTKIVVQETRPTSVSELTGTWKQIEMDRKAQTIRLPAQTRIDLGGIAKGYTANKLIEMLNQYAPCLVDAGGDLVAGDAPRAMLGWPVAVAAPLYGAESEEQDIVGLWLENAALMTSGVDRRRWTQQGQTMHHLIDPITGKPSEQDIMSATIFETDASRAEAWATAAVIAGMDKGLDLLTEQGLSGILVGTDGEIRLIGQMQTIGTWQLSVRENWNMNGVSYYAIGN